MHNSCLKHNFYRDPHHRLNFEFLVGFFTVGKLRVERKLHIVLAPIVHDFLYLRRLLNQILFFSRGEIGQMTHPPLNGSFPPQLSVTKSSSLNLNRLAKLCSDILLFSTTLIVCICHTSIANLSYSNFITVWLFISKYHRMSETSTFR